MSDPSANAEGADRVLSTDHLQDDLRGRSVRGGAITFVGQSFGIVLSVLSTVILARLLSPGDYGLMGMLTAVGAFLALFKDAGLSVATVQRQRLSHQLVSNLFWLNVTISAVQMLLLVAIAPLMVWVFDEPRLLWLMVLSSPQSVISGLAIQHYALLRRQMRFGALAVVPLVAQAVGLVVGVTMAATGWMYWSLVGMSMSTALATTVAVWLMCRWVPTRFRRGAGVRDVVRFGGNLTAAGLANYFAMQSDYALIGYRWGADALGHYTRAYALLMLPIRQINAPLGSVALPVISRLATDPPRLRRFYTQALALVALLSFPTVMLMMMLADDVILLALGDQWTQAGPLFRVLAIAALVTPVTQTGGWLFRGLGLGRQQLHWSVFSSAVLVTSFIVGLPWGALGVAWGFAAAQWLLAPLWATYIGRQTPIQPADLGRALWRPGLSVLLASLATAALLRTLPDEAHPSLRVLAACSMMAIIHGIIMLVVFRQANYYLSLLRLLRPSQSP